MESCRQVLKITAEQWHAKEKRGLAAVIAQRPYIVLTDESTREPVYQPVSIINANNAGTQR